MKSGLLFFLVFSLCKSAVAQQDSIQTFTLYNDVNITLDRPPEYVPSKKTLLILYALPNGSTTLQTMGKKLQPGDDWRFDIQHIKAQTSFIRKKMRQKNIVVAYLENNFKSWPARKTKHPGYVEEVQHIVDTLYSLFPGNKTAICLNGHSGGGRFIFSYLDGIVNIPSFIERIVFLDSDYGYEKQYGIQIQKWLKSNKDNSLQVFAYEDSLVELNGKRIVSDTGGTWYRTHQMFQDLSVFFNFKTVRNDSLMIYKSIGQQISFYLKPNPEKKIYHTTQVELNGFIQSILAGTKYESKGYEYFGKRAYLVN